MKRREIKRRGERRACTELAQRREVTESCGTAGQSGRPLPTAAQKTNNVSLQSKMQRNKGGAQGRGVKIKPGLPGLKLPAEKVFTDKPLAGKVFYLDVTSKLLSEKFEKDIKELGGTVEGFLSKEISCLITCKKEAKCTKSLQYLCSLSSPEPAQNTGSRRGGTQEGGSNKKPSKDDVSRGKSLLKKVIKEQEMLQKNSILANAWNWGVEILHVDDAKISLETKKRLFIPVKLPAAPSKPVVKRPYRSQTRAQKLKTPFIKVEDCSKQYRPLYLVLPCFQSFQSPPPPPPKQCKSVAKKAATTKARETKQGLNKTLHGQDAGYKQKEGYCECCLKKYNDLEDHVTGTQHHMFSLGPHYQDVDHLISKFEFDFVDWSVVSQEAVKRSVLMPTVAVDWKEKKIADAHHQFSSGVNLSGLELLQPRQRMEPEVLLAATDCPGNNIQSPEPGFYPPCPVQTVRNDAMETDSVPPGTPVFLPYTDKSLHLAGGTLSAYLADMYSPPHTPQGPTPGPSVAATPMESSSPEPGSECLTVALANTYKSLNPAGETITAYEHMHSPIQTPQGPNLGRSVAATPIAQSSPEPGNECRSKRIKLDGSLASVTLYSVPVEADNVTSPKPVIDAVPEAMEPACLLHSEALHDQSPHGSPTKLHRKVKPLVRKVKQDEPCVPPACKVSVPEEDGDLSSSEKRLLSLFETSEVQSEFCGFPCRSESFPHTIDAKEDFLWCCFSNTGSSGTTFEGF